MLLKFLLIIICCFVTSVNAQNFTENDILGKWEYDWDQSGKNYHQYYGNGLSYHNKNSFVEENTYSIVQLDDKKFIISETYNYKKVKEKFMFVYIINFIDKDTFSCNVILMANVNVVIIDENETIFKRIK